MEYELVREIKNLCPNNQMRDIFFEEVETDDPIAYVKTFLKGKILEISVQNDANDVVTVYASCDGLVQKFIFTPIWNMIYVALILRQEPQYVHLFDFTPIFKRKNIYLGI